MMKKIIFVLIIVILASSNNAFGQGGSNYSIIGIGDINSISNANYHGLAGTAISMKSDHGINFKNPAMWAYAKSTRLQVGYIYNQHLSISDEETLAQNNTQFNGFSSILSIDTALGSSVSFGLYPYSSVNYTVQNPVLTELDGTILQGKNVYTGDGGLATAYFGTSIKPFDFLALGVSVNAIFGKIYSINETIFFGDPYAFDHTTYKDDFFSGFGFKVGANFTGIKNFSLGAYYEKFNDFKINRELTYNLPYYTDTTTSSELYTAIPQSFGIGASYSYKNYLFGADYSVQDFTGFDYNKGSGSEFISGNYLSIGVLRKGETGYGKNFAERTTYKAGLGIKTLYYQIHDNQINDYCLAFGASMPIKGTWIIDTGLTVGMRGTTNDGLLQEYYSKFSVSLSIGEIWFKPYRR